MSFDWNEWYKKNKQERNKVRKDRYHSDPEYRAKALEVSRRSRINKRQRESIPKVEAKKVLRGISYRKIEYAPGKHGVTIGFLSKTLGISIATARSWINKGILPDTGHRSSRGDRVYSLEDIALIKESLTKAGYLPVAPCKRRRGVVRKVRFVGGEQKELRLFRIGEVAMISGRNISTLIQMEGRGSLPSTPLRSGKHRLYTLSMLNILELHFKRLDQGLIKVGEFSNSVIEGWKEEKVLSTSGDKDAEVLSK